MKTVTGYSNPPLEDVLEHYGVKGMKWGVRRSQAALDRAAGRTPRKTNRQARKDAQESARAKMYYGDGAGTRRKLIRETVDSRSKKDPKYKEAFERHSQAQDMEKHTKKAISERKSTDRKDTTKKTAKAIARQTTGEMGNSAAMVAIVLAGGAYLSTPQGRAMASKLLSSIQSKGAKGADAIKNVRRAKMGEDWLRALFAG